MHNFPYEENPKFWSEYFGHEHAKTLAEKFIRGGVSNMPRSMFISGPSGCGKTTFVKLLIKSMRCLNRPDESIEPCGICEACLEEDVRLADRSTSNVIWVQPGGFTEEPETLGKQLKYALAEAAKGHRHTNRPERDILWLVFDEWQEFPSNLRVEVFQRCESEPPNNNVCYVFMTMQKEKLGVQELIGVQRRGNPISLPAFTPTEIKLFLIQKYQLTAQIAGLISENCMSSLGLAIAYYDNIRQIDPLMSEEVTGYVLSTSSNSERYKLWTMLEEGCTYANLNLFIEKLLKKVNSKKLVQQLQKDILKSSDMTGVISNDAIFAIQLLNNYLMTSADLLTFFIPLFKKRLVQKAAVLLDEDFALNYLSL